MWDSFKGHARTHYLAAELYHGTVKNGSIVSYSFCHGERLISFSFHKAVQVWLTFTHANKVGQYILQYYCHFCNITVHNTNITSNFFQAILLQIISTNCSKYNIRGMRVQIKCIHMSTIYAETDICRLKFFTMVV